MSKGIHPDPCKRTKITTKKGHHAKPRTSTTISRAHYALLER